MRCIDLITVVLAWVVRSRDHDTRRGVQIAGRKGHGRHRHQDGPDIDLDAIGRKHSGGHFCKHIALDAAVVADGHRRLCKVLFQIIGQALRGLCHGIDVHAVGACADDAAQTARAKGKVTVKRIFDFGINIFFKSISLWTKANKPTAGRIKAIHRRLDSFSLIFYLLLILWVKTELHQSLPHITSGFQLLRSLSANKYFC